MDYFNKFSLYTKCYRKSDDICRKCAKYSLLKSSSVLNKLHKNKKKDLISFIQHIGPNKCI